MKTVVIIGGGFSGIITAINLARFSAEPLHLSVVDKNRLPCRGIAYSTRNSSHLLNVLARNMSALADQPNHFVEWLGTRADYLDVPLATIRETFVPRKMYGDYLHSLFHWYSRILADEKKMRLELINDEVNDVVIENQRATVTLAGGQVLLADKVILAVGNQEPSQFRLRGLDLNSPKYIGNPWIGWEEKLPAPDKDLLLIGTGLTMVDTFLTLQDLNWKGKIFAVSRNGLLPLSHFKGFEYPDLLNDDTPPLSFPKMLALFKKHYHDALSRNLNPAILVDKLRPFTQRIWQNFSLAEKKRFNRHLRTRWNVVRHRIAPEIHRQLQTALAENRLEVIKGRLCEGQESGDTIKVCVESNRIRRNLSVGSVINCTGPRESYVPSDSGLFNNLFARGLIQPDDMNMGIKVAPTFSVMGRDGKNSPTLFALGAIMKGTLWESVAVPELRSQAFRLAQSIASQLVENEADKNSISEVMENVLEYSI